MERAQTTVHVLWGLGLQSVLISYRGTVLGKQAKESESLVLEMRYITGRIQSTARHVKPCGKTGGPPPKAKYYSVTDCGEVL